MFLSKKKYIIFIEFIYLILIITKYILYTIQIFVNQNFAKYKIKSALTEKLFYENFGTKIFNNMGSKSIYKIKSEKNSKMEKLKI